MRQVSSGSNPWEAIFSPLRLFSHSKWCSSSGILDPHLSQASGKTSAHHCCRVSKQSRHTIQYVGSRRPYLCETTQQSTAENNSPSSLRLLQCSQLSYSLTDSLIFLPNLAKLPSAELTRREVSNQASTEADVARYVIRDFIQPSPHQV